MKKVLCIVVILVYVFAGCSPKEHVSEDGTAPTDAPTQSPTEKVTAEPTEEPTPSPSPEPTPDADPKAKLMLNEEEFATFLKLWPAKTSPLEDHGSIKRFSINAQTGFDSSTVNFIFSADKSVAELEEMYMALVSGEWETSEYSAGPTVYGGMLENSIETTCQISTVDGENEVFLGMYINNGSETLSDSIAAHWPIGFLDMPEDISDEVLNFDAMAYEPGTSITFTRTYEPEDLDSAMTFFKDSLSGEEYYAFNERGEYSGASVTCTKDGVIIKISESMETRIEISLTASID